MTRLKYFWSLTIHYYPNAVKAGVKPISTSFGEFLEDDGKNPALYRPYEFYFESPPTRNEFLEVVRLTPWASHAWSNTLVPVIAINPWPMLDWLNKSSSQNLIDSNNLLVGRINIHREEVHVNTGMNRDFCITSSMYSAITQKYGTGASNLLFENKNLVLERAQIQWENFEGEHDTILRDVINDFFYEKGIRKTKPKKVKNAKDL